MFLCFCNVGVFVVSSSCHGVFSTRGSLKCWKKQNRLRTLKTCEYYDKCGHKLGDMNGKFTVVSFSAKLNTV